MSAHVGFCSREGHVTSEIRTQLHSRQHCDRRQHFPILPCHTRSCYSFPLCFVPKLGASFVVRICLSMVNTEAALAFSSSSRNNPGFSLFLPQKLFPSSLPLSAGKAQRFPSTPIPNRISEKETGSGITFLNIFCPLVKNQLYFYIEGIKIMVFICVKKKNEVKGENPGDLTNCNIYAFITRKFSTDCRQIVAFNMH